MKMNVFIDKTGQLKQMVFSLGSVTIPFMYIFNIKGILQHRAHPMAKTVETHLVQQSGQSALHQTLRSNSPRYRSWFQPPVEEARGLSPSRYLKLK